MVFVIDALGFGGAERSLAELLPGLAAAGIDPVVVCLHHREGVEANVRAQGFDVRILPAGRGARLAALRRVMEDDSPALIHTTLAAATLTARCAAVGTGVPVLTSLVSQSYGPERMADPHVRPAAVRAIRLVDGWSARHLTTHFHAITHAVKRWAVETLRVTPRRVTVVERGRDPRRLGEAGLERRASARLRLGLPPNAPVLVAVGRQEYAKGHRFLLTAMPRVIAAHPSAVLLLAGRPGAETVHLRQLADRMGAGRSIRFLGHRDDLPDVLAACDLFVFPSLWEGLGGSLIEAMALRLPIVASELEPIREVVEGGSCAVLVPPRDPMAIGSAISSLLGDRNRARDLGSRGREIFERRFTLDRSTERMISLLHRVAQTSVTVRTTHARRREVRIPTA